MKRIHVELFSCLSSLRSMHTRASQAASTLNTPLKQVLPTLGRAPAAPKKEKILRFRSWVVDGIRRCPSLESYSEEVKKRRMEKKMSKLREEERRIYEKWNIRHKYLKWTPMEVELISDRTLLLFLYEKFVMPSSQPRNSHEKTFFQLMGEAIIDRLHRLESNLV